MSAQASLFEPPRVTSPKSGITHSNPSDTELAAAIAIAPRTGTSRFAVLEMIVISGLRGLTDEELATFGNMLRQSVCGRRRELVLGGWIEDSRRRRRGRTGLQHVIWVATERGKRAYEAESKS